MVNAGRIVTVPDAALAEVAQAYPDLRGMKKAERTPILKQKINALKTSLRNTLNGLKGAYEFEVNGSILEARLYDTGVAEVMERMTQQKAGMLTQSGQIFHNAQYLYSTPDYESNPNIYRWNYFYTPVRIGSQTIGVRIAVRDVVQGQNRLPESQIYHWGIKENASLGGGQPGQLTSSLSASSDAFSTATIAQQPSAVNPPSAYASAYVTQLLQSGVMPDDAALAAAGLTAEEAAACLTQSSYVPSTRDFLLRSVPEQDTMGKTTYEQEGTDNDGEPSGDRAGALQAGADDDSGSVSGARALDEGGPGVPGQVRGNRPQAGRLLFVRHEAERINRRAFEYGAAALRRG